MPSGGMTEARLTRNRAKATDTPLTAPLPYGSTKSRREAVKDVDAARTALFDITNDSSETVDQGHVPGAGGAEKADDIVSVAKSVTPEVSPIEIGLPASREEAVVKKLGSPHLAVTEQRVHCSPSTGPSAEVLGQQKSANLEPPMAGSPDIIGDTPDTEIVNLVKQESTEEMFELNLSEDVDLKEPIAQSPTLSGSIFPAQDDSDVAATEEVAMPTPAGDRWAMHGSAAKSLQGTGSAAKPLFEDVEENVPSAARTTRMASTIVVPQPITYDPRSLRQLRKELKEAKVQAQPANSADSSCSSQYTDVHMPAKGVTQSREEEVMSKLTDALGGMRVATDSPLPLRGLPVREGHHIRFNDDGEGEVSPGQEKTLLRGLPVPRGQHTRFD